MKHPVKTTFKKNINAIEVIVDSVYYNDNLTYRTKLKNERTQQVT